jgi:hypothetical protein
MTLLSSYSWIDVTILIYQKAGSAFAVLPAVKAQNNLKNISL